MADGVTFAIEDPEVFDVFANLLPPSKPHVHWRVGVAPEVDDEGGRLVFSTLHSFSENGGGEATVAVRVVESGDLTETPVEFVEAFASSSAMELLYDITRSALRSVLAIVDSSTEVPTEPPGAEMSLLAPDPDDDDAEEIEAVSGHADPGDQA